LSRTLREFGLFLFYLGQAGPCAGKRIRRRASRNLPEQTDVSPYILQATCMQATRCTLKFARKQVYVPPFRWPAPAPVG